MEAMNIAKMSFVNEVKNLTTNDPWKHDTVSAIRMTQKLIQVLQTRNSTSAFLENLYKASSNTISGPVTPSIKNFESAFDSQTRS